MNKKFLYIGIALILLGLSGILVIVYKNSKGAVVKACTEEVKVCPDDSTVRRIETSCEFAACPVKQETILPVATTTLTSATSTATTGDIVATTSEALPKTKTAPAKTSIKNPITIFTSAIKSVEKSLSSVITSISYPFTTPVTNYSSSQSIPASTYIANSSTDSTPAYKPLPPSDFAGEKYIVDGNNILSNDNKLVYTIPPEVIAAVGSGKDGWTDTTINVVPVGEVAPILNAIPIKDLPGKYYLSENSFGDVEKCEFSNKIFILDTVANTATLLYEENNTTLSPDDPRACNSEIFLLQTERDNLVLKYHTLRTNTLCDSAWSEPEKTFYLDVTKLATEGMRKYEIPEALSSGAEQEEDACRSSMQVATTTGQ